MIVMVVLVLGQGQDVYIIFGDTLLPKVAMGPQSTVHQPALQVFPALTVSKPNLTDSPCMQLIMGFLTRCSGPLNEGDRATGSAA